MERLDIGKEKRAVPVLRFKEFDGEWSGFKIGDVATKVGSGSTPSGGNQVYQNYGVPFIRSQNIANNKLNLDDTHISEEINTKMNGSIVKPNDILLNITGASIGRTCVVPSDFERGNVNQHVCIIRLKDQFNPKFLQPFLSSQKGQKLVYQGQTGSGREGLNFKSIRLFKLGFPSLPEQKKIATFLSTIDKKIQQLTRKKALLEAYKKGLMQQLFSGVLRFRDEEGKDYPAWEEKFYGDIFSFYSTNSFSRVNLNYESGTVKNIHYGDIHTKFSTLFNIREEFVPYVNSEINTVKIKEECYCQEGDLVIADASEDYSDIGKAIELIELNNEKLIAGLHTFLARPNKTKMYIGFSGYLVQAWYIRKQIMTIAQGTKVLSLSTTRMVKLKVNVPCLQEQKKIANYLSSIDKKIETITTQITKTQTFKKGLLQQMFV